MMSKEFILKTSKSVRRCADTITEKKPKNLPPPKKKKEKQTNNSGHIEKIYCFMSISFFVAYLLKSKLITFYNRIFYFYI